MKMVTVKFEGAQEGWDIKSEVLLGLGITVMSKKVVRKVFSCLACIGLEANLCRERCPQGGGEPVRIRRVCLVIQRDFQRAR